jgi:hypothetical protein
MSELHIEAQVVERTDALVHVTYSVENTTGTDILVCHRLYRERTPDGVYVVDPHLVYVLFEPGPVPNITKRILDRGEDVNVEHPIQPLARTMAPGERYEEHLVVALPIAPFDPYRPVAPRDPASAEPSRGIAVSIGWLERDALDDVLVPEVASNVGPLRLVKASPVVQHLARVELDTSVPVLPPMPSSALQRQCSVCASMNVGDQASCLRCGSPLPAPSAPAVAGWQPTHRVPAGGLQGYVEPGGALSVPLDGSLPVQVVERAGDWARVVVWTGWSGWVDGRPLEPM